MLTLNALVSNLVPYIYGRRVGVLMLDKYQVQVKYVFREQIAL